MGQGRNTLGTLYLRGFISAWPALAALHGDLSVCTKQSSAYPRQPAGKTAITNLPLCRSSGLTTKDRDSSGKGYLGSQALGTLKAQIQCLWQNLFWKEGYSSDKFRLKSPVSPRAQRVGGVTHRTGVSLCFLIQVHLPGLYFCTSHYFALWVFSLVMPFPQRLATVKCRNKH